jgi:hypothetical protein
MFTTRVINNLPSAEKIIKNINFGTAVGLTKTAGEAKSAVIGAWKGKFTIRNPWLERSPIGPKIKPATRDKLTAEVSMSAKFARLQDEGGIKLPYKNYLAMPADSGPLAGKKRIPVAMRPKNLKDAFILTTKSGTKLLCIRKMSGRGKNRSSGVVPMYVLIPRASIKRADIFRDPIEKVVNRRLKPNISAGITRALQTMR